MSVYLGTQLLSGVATNTISNGHSLFDFKWTDHIINEMSWLRSDTFSWQNGTVYSEAYNHLVTDYNGGTSTTETVGSYTITYVLASDGHKITTDETAVANIYNESGVAWYYILDTANQRFKLPRINPAREELITLMRAKGNGKSLGIIGKSGNTIIENSLAHIRGYWFAPGSLASADVGAAAVEGSIPVGTYAGINTDSTKSGIVIDPTESDTTFTGKQYLYFYVGQFSQSAIEQTAGLNSELFPSKVDLNAANLSTAGKSLISGLGMPSNTYEDLTLGASGSTYTAPANGYFSVSKYANGANQFLGMYNATNKIACFWNNPANGNLCEQFIPVKKGDVIQVNYNLGGNTQRFVFIYAQGEENV